MWNQLEENYDEKSWNGKEKTYFLTERYNLFRIDFLSKFLSPALVKT